MNDSQVYAATALLGITAGMRSMSAPAIVCVLANQGYLPIRTKPLEVLAHPASVATTAALAVGEIIADKLPFVPSRISAAPLITRAISGALCGAALGSALGAAKQRSVLSGIVIGACAAVGGSYVAYFARRSAAQSTGLPDPALAVLEDGLVALNGWLLLRSLEMTPVRD